MSRELHIWTQAPQAYTNQRLVQEGHSLNLSVVVGQAENTPVRPPRGSLVLLRSSALSYLDHDVKRLELWQKTRGVLTPNCPHWSAQLRDKLKGVELLEKLGQNLPPTFALDDPLLITQLKECQGQEIYRGHVVKPRRSNQGKGLFVLDSLSSLASVARAFNDLGDTRFVVQPRLLKKREWRVLALPGRALLWILRSPKDPQEILGNRSFCDECLFETRHEEKLREFGAKLQKSLSKLSYWGADVIEAQNGELYLLEVNPSPGLQGAEQLTGQNLVGQLLTSLLGTLAEQVQ